MGTKVHSKSLLPGYNYFMRDLNEDSSSSSWPLCYGEKAIINGQCYNGFTSNGYPVYGKDALKQKMLEHEAVFKDQVYELHRLYRIQRDLMEEAKRKELCRIRASMEPSSSSSLRESQVPMAGFSLLNSGYKQTSISGVEIVNSPSKGKFAFSSLKDSEPSYSRPLKLRKKLFDLELPADEYDTEDDKKSPEWKVSDVSSYALNGNLKSGPESRVAESASASRLKNSVGLADLNEPIEIEEATAASSINGETKGLNPPAKSNAGYLGVSEETRHHTDGFLINSFFGNERGRLSHLYEAGPTTSNRNSLPNVLQRDRLPLPSHHPCGIYSTGHSKEDLWRDKNHCVPESSDRRRNQSNNGHLESHLASVAPHSGPFFGSYFSGSGACSVPSWAKPMSSFTQNVTTLISRNGGHRELIVTSDSTTNHDSGHFPKGSCEYSKRLIDINLNEVVPSLQDVTMIDEKGKHEMVTDLNQPFTPEKVVKDSSEVKTEIFENQNVKKILGFPIFGCPSEGNGGNKERKKIVIDINVECEPEEHMADEELTVEKEKQTKSASVRDFIDLNSCVTDCEDTLAPSFESKKPILDIDLESPVVLEKEDTDTPLKEKTVESKIESPPDEVLRNAADTILAMSSSCPDSLEASVVESLLWFIDAVSSCAISLKDGSPKELPEEMDDFEAMTLQIPETKEENYMPIPFVPEGQKGEETGASTLPTRPRRGQSRRGRQRRDFQRDILPGLASLSRHEVTEDIQTFGGLMRATGHHWISGLARRNGSRNGGGRGRRRAVVETEPTQAQVCTTLIQQLNSIEAGLEERSLTGWGKTTRRPRRQRCPHAGNPPAVVII